VSLVRDTGPVPLRPAEEALDRVTDLRLRVVALETALATSDRVVQPSLRDFLT
jgi:hypothetical protein